MTNPVQSKLPKAKSGWYLNVSNNEGSIASLGNLFQCLNTQSKKAFFLHLNVKYCISVCALCLFSCHWAQLRRVCLYHLYSPYQVSPLHLVFSRLNSLSSLSLSLYETCSCPLKIFVTLCRTLSSMSMFLLSLGAQIWTQHCRCGLISAQQSRKITSFNLRAMFFLIQTKVLLVVSAARAPCWLMFNLVCNWISRVLLYKTVFQLVRTSMLWYMGLFLPRCRSWRFLFLNFMRFPSSHFFSLPESL